MATGTILDRIMDTKRDEIAVLRSRYRSGTARELREQCVDLPPTRGFKRALASPHPPAPSPSEGRGGVKGDNGFGERDPAFSPVSPPLPSEGEGAGGWGLPRLIAEVKKASPSRGIIRADFDPVTIAQAYEQGGASCLSVLTDESYFQGSLGYLAAIREVVALPLLRKDFILEPIQVYEARLAGADAILLIVACLPSPARLSELRHVAESLGMDALVEVHDAAEAALAVESGATLIGVNNRDLHTFTLSLETTARLIPTFPDGVVAVAESGIFTPEDVAFVRDAGAHAILVGESLMREPDVTAATQRLLATVSTQ